MTNATTLHNLHLTHENIDQIGALSNRDLLDLSALSRDFQQLALSGTDANAIRYSCDLRAACIMEMQQRNNSNMKGA